MKNYFLTVSMLLIIALLSGCQKNRVPVFDVDKGGMVLDWILMGPFPSDELTTRDESGANRSGFNEDFLTGLGGENKAILYDGVETTIQKKNGETRTVRAKRIGPEFENPNRPDFNKIINNNTRILDRDYDQDVAYAFCYLYSEETQKIYAHMSVDGSHKVWLNDTLVFAQWADWSKSVGKNWMYNFELNVKKGENRFLIKIDNTESWWGFGIELYNKEQNDIEINKTSKSLTFKKIESTPEGIHLLIGTIPELAGYQVPVKVTVTKFTGEKLTEKEILTGSNETIPAIENYDGPVYLEISPSGNNTGQTIKDVRWSGDYKVSLSALKKKYDIVKSQYTSFIPQRIQKLYGHVFRYYDRFFSKEQQIPDISFVSNFNFARRLVEALEKRQDLLSHIPTEGIPVSFEVKGYVESDREEICAHVSIPENYAGSGNSFPLVIEMRPYNSFGKEISHLPNANLLIEMQGEPIIAVKPYPPNISSRMQSNYWAQSDWWEPFFLDKVLEQIKDIFSVDAERIYVYGGSGGAARTWDWINHSPEHFAAAIILVGFDGYPFRAEKLKYLPLWVINGDLDLASYPYQPEVTINRLRSFGSDVAYTNFTGLGHSVSPGFDKKDLKEWLLAHRNPHKIGLDPLVNMSINEEGFSKVTLKRIPDKTYLGLTPMENPRYPQDNPFRSAMKIYQAYRKPNSAATEREARGYALIYEKDYSKAEGKEILLDAPVVDLGKNGDLRKKDIKDCNVASVFIKCADNPDKLNEIKLRVASQLMADGYKLTGEVFNYMLNIATWHDRYWEVCFVLCN